MFKKTLIGLALGLSLASAMAQEINFGIISTESTQSLKANWQPLLDAMSKKTGLTIKAFFAPDYAGVIEGMRFNKVQVAWMGNKSAMEAVDRANGEIYAKVVNADGTEGYYSHLIVHKDSAIKSLDDVIHHGKNFSFGNGDPNSTSGFLVPGYYVFSKNHIDAKTHFKVMRSANHETNALTVANKQVDVATNNSENLAKLKNSNPEKAKQLRVIWTSPLIPSDPMVYRKDLPQATKEKIKQFFLEFAKNDASEKEIMARMNWSVFRASTDAQLKPIRQLSLFGKRNKIAADTTLSAAEKEQQLAKIDQQLAALN
jgi:phosphonate transport system substrate-binding protein